MADGMATGAPKRPISGALLSRRDSPPSPPPGATLLPLWTVSPRCCGRENRRGHWLPAPLGQPSTEEATMRLTRGLWLGLLATLAAVMAVSAPAAAQQPKPNIVVIMGDDIGIWNIGAYHRGMMAGLTPNLDKIAAEGM